ncbi:MAG TPA: methyltransferase, partial [Kineosporiaceae bacterium]
MALFEAGDATAADTPSHARAPEGLSSGGSVLDVGCGGGRAAFAVAPQASLVIGVDHQPGMLDAFPAAAERRGLSHAERRGLSHQEVIGDWPQVADDAPVADVVVCHHVAYNVADLAAFVTALDAHARRRIVLELPRRHPLSGMAPLWRHFWNLERPEHPTAQDALAVVREQGFAAEILEWDEPSTARVPSKITPEQQVEYMRIRLCLTPDRDPEIAEVMARLPDTPRQLATIWWDAAPDRELAGPQNPAGSRRLRMGAPWPGRCPGSAGSEYDGNRYTCPDIRGRSRAWRSGPRRVP